jgi:hypothetical protein
MNVWIGILLLIFLAGIGARLVDVCLKAPEKRRIHNKIVDLWCALGEPDPRVVIQAPIRLITRALDAAYGERLFSLMAFRRSSLVTLSLFAFALVLSTIRTGMPFSLDDLPWRNFDRTFATIETVAKNEAERTDQKPEVREVSRRVFEQIKRYNNPENRLAYAILCFPCIAAVAAALNFGCIAFARQALAEMGQAKSLVTLFSLGLGNLFVSLCIYVFGLSLICVIATPFSWLVVWALVACGYYFSWLLALGLLLPSVIVALFLSPSWIKVLASVIIVHGTLVMFISLGALFVFPVRKAVRWVLLEFLDRAVSSEKGFFAFCAVAFAAVGALAAGLARAFTGKFPF